MTFPTPYARLKDFTVDTAADTQELNDELDNLGEILNEVLGELKKIQRADSAVANAIVHKDAFTADALALMGGSWTPRGTWETATDYVIGDVVDHDSGDGAVPYVATEAHTSGVFATDRAAGKWTQLGTAASALTISSFAETLLDDPDYETALQTLGGSAIGRALFIALNASSARSLLGLVIGTDVLAPTGSGANLTDLPFSAAETGDVKFSFLTAIDGWLLLNGDTLGSAASVADHTNDAYDALYTVLWDNLADTEAPVTGGRGASAAADFAANKPIRIPDARGRVMIGLDNMGGSEAGRVTNAQADILGGSLGAETKTILTANLPSHTHASGTLSAVSGGAHQHDVSVNDTASGDGSGTVRGAVNPSPNATITNAAASAGAHTHTISGSTGAAGSGTALNILPPMLALNAFIKL